MYDFSGLLETVFVEQRGTGLCETLPNWLCDLLAIRNIVASSYHFRRKRENEEC